MTLYVDSSALMKRYVEEAESDRVNELLVADPIAVTGRHTVVEVRRNLSKVLDVRGATAARAQFTSDLASFSIVELDQATTELAATIAEQTGVRSLDALHLGAAQRLGTALTFLTFDVRQAQAARSLGFAVVGS